MRPSKKITSPLQRKSGVPDNLRNCKHCGKVFIVAGDDLLCPDCLKQEEHIRTRVMDYVRDNPGVTIEQALQATGVPDRVLKRMILEGKFTTDSENPIAKTIRKVCAICGKPIEGAGIYCRRCTSRMVHESKHVANQSIDRISNKKVGDMSIIDRLNAQAAREFEIENLKRQIGAK